MKTLLIDNYDSFTFNLYQALAGVNGTAPVVVRNDEATLDELRRGDFDNLVISPGPGRPERRRDFGVCADAIRELDLPVLGVCLGMQGLAWVYGGRIDHAPEAMHGRLSPVRHSGADLFAGLPQGFLATRYHSLIVDAASLPDCLEGVAWTPDGILMGIRHRRKPLWGVQFHPESICTEHGVRLLGNFRALTEAHHRSRPRRKPRRTPDAPMAAPTDALPPPKHGVGGRIRWRRLASWIEPEACFTGLLADKPDCFWLDSALAAEARARFSFMGAADGPGGRVLRYDQAGGLIRLRAGNRVRRLRASVFDHLRRELRESAVCASDYPLPFAGGFVGYLGYELKAECGGRAAHVSPRPDAAFIFADRFLAFDHRERHVYLVALDHAQTTAEIEDWFNETTVRLRDLDETPPLETGAARPLAVTLARGRGDYERDVERCKALIREGESYEICLTNAIAWAGRVDPLTYYRVLRRRNPAPFAAFFKIDGMAVVSSSPERFLRIGADRRVEAKPIKGTQRRGRGRDDGQLREALRVSEKNRSENLMIVDLLRNDLGRVCEIGSVQVPKLMDIETYATLHQMVSTVSGRLRPDVDAVTCLRHVFPGGSMTGAPKLRTMEIIDRLEAHPRGVYAGALGYFGVDGSADFSIVIRTAVVDADGVSIGAGGGIVALSDAAEEFDEAMLKAQALLEALRLTPGLEPGPAPEGAVGFPWESARRR